MKIVVPPIYERSSDGIEFEDYFQRNAVSNNLTNIFRKADGLVLSIEAPWGEGKTTFIKSWESQLRKGGDFISIYYDAFKSDFTDDAFSSIAVMIQEAIKVHDSAVLSKRKNGRQFQRLKEGARNIVKDAIKFGASMAVTNLSAGIIDGSGLVSKATDALVDAANDSLDVQVDERLNAHSKAQDHIQEYRDALEAVLASGNKKIVFFVDELDRCRPDFAIKVLEKVKHLFSVRNVFFVLSINRSQLLSIVQHSYGVGKIESEIYLQKFINLEVRLPSLKWSLSVDSDALAGFVNSLLKEHGICVSGLARRSWLPLFVSYIGPDVLEVGPRGIERIFTLVSICLAANSQRDELFVKSVFFAASVKVCNSDVYQKIKSGYMSDHVLREIRLTLDRMKAYFDSEYTQSASNTMDVSALKKVCDLLDLFVLPEINEYDVADSER